MSKTKKLLKDTSNRNSQDLTLWGISDAKNGEESAQNYTVRAGKLPEESWDHCFNGYYWFKIMHRTEVSPP